LSKIVFIGSKDLFNKTFKTLPNDMNSLYIDNLDHIKKINCDLLIYSVKSDKELNKFTLEYRSYLNLTNIPIIYIFDRKVYELFYFKNNLDDYMIKPFYIKDIVTRVKVRLNVKDLQDRLRNLINEQITILDLSSVFTSHYNYKTRLKTVVMKLSKIFRADDISMILINNSILEVVTDLNSDPKKFMNIPLDLNKYPEIQEAISIRKPLYIKNIQEYERLSPYIEHIKNKGIRSILILPIIYHNEVLGVISIKFTTVRSDTYDHLLKYSMIITNTTAIAIKNAQILEKISKEMEIKTSFKVKQQEMAKSLKHYSHFVDKASIPMLLVDIRGNIHFINKQVENILEYDKFKILTMNFFSIFSDKDKNIIKEKLTSLTELNSYMEFDSFIKLPFIDEKNLKFNISRFQKNTFLVQIDDQLETNKITEKKIHSLNNVIQFYENLIDLSNEAYIGVNREGDIILFNGGAEQALGYSNQEVKEIKIWDLYPSLKTAKEIAKELYKNNGKIKDYPTKLKSKFNNMINVKLNAFFIYDNNNTTIGSIGIFKLD